jgi:hypothetical protein
MGDDAVMLGPIKEDMFVNLIGEDANIIGAFLPNHLGNFLQLAFRSHPSCGVGWEIEKDHLRFLVEQGRQFLTREAEVFLLLQMNRDGFSPNIIDEGFIDGKGGAGVDDLISRIAVSLLTKADRRLCTRENNNALRGCLNSPCLAQMLRNGFAKRQNSLMIAVRGIVEVDLSLDLFLDVLRHRKIGFPEVALDDLFPLILQPLNLWPYFECILCIDESNVL